MVINRTFDGYMTEIKTIYGQLQSILQKDFPEIKIKPASDEWDRLYNVDFYILINGKYIGLQIKPISNDVQLSQIFKERGLQKRTHEKFHKEFGGKVFYIFSIKDNGKKRIANEDVIEELQQEIERLKRDSG